MTESIIKFEKMTLNYAASSHLSHIKIDQHPDLPSRQTIVNLFKATKINDVWKELDIPITPKPSYTKDSVSKALKKTGHLSQKPSYTKEEVAKALKEIGYLPEREVRQHPDLPPLYRILKLFKTSKTNDIWKELGIPITSRPSYTKDSVSKTLKKTGWLETKEVEQHPDLPAHRTVLNLFNTTSMDDVWEELDIDIFGI